MWLHIPAVIKVNPCQWKGLLVIHICTSGWSPMPIHYLNQYWLFVNGTSGTNSKIEAKHFYKKMYFKIASWKRVAFYQASLCWWPGLYLTWHCCFGRVGTSQHTKSHTQTTPCSLHIYPDVTSDNRGNKCVCLWHISTPSARHLLGRCK